MTDAPPLTDRELDDRLRQATDALLALASPTRQDGLAARVEAELAGLDGPRALETTMTTDTDDDAPASTSIAPPTASAGAGRTEDSGLHDLKALAKDTRKRISRRITSQHDVDERLLSASHSGLRAVALPEPAMVVAFPEAPTSLAEVRPASAASVAAIEAAAPASKPKRTALWIGAGAIGLAAAAAAVILSGGGGGGDKPAEPQLAAAGPAGSATTVSAPAIEPAPPPAAAPAVVVAASPPEPAKPEVAGAPAAMAGGAAASGDRVEVKVRGTEPKPADVRAGDPKAGEPKPARTDDKPGKTDPKGDPKTAGKPDPKTEGDGKPGGAAAGKPSGEKSIEDLLNDATGTGGKPKDDPATPTGPTKSGLEPKEIKAGMSAVAGAAQGCYGKHGEAGHVKIKAVVAPSGSVTKADATGEFAGTPTGACVAAAVKGASFPSWTGAPMTVTYSFTLQE
jgi:hypothetical protein